MIETLGAATDLEHLRAVADPDKDVDIRLADLRRTVAALEADTISADIKVQQRIERILTQIVDAAKVVSSFNLIAYEQELEILAGLEQDYRTFRTALFEAADLPAEPDETWSEFVEAGENYKEHLTELGAHDADRCLYCRQELNESALALVGKYSEYLEDKITADISASKARFTALAAPLVSAKTNDVAAFANEHSDTNDKPPFQAQLERTLAALSTL